MYGDRTSGFAPHFILELAMGFCRMCQKYTILVYPIKEYIFVRQIKTNMDKSIHSHLYHQVIGRLRSKREGKGVTQAQLADKLGVNQNFISKIETCDRRLDLIELRQICQVLGISFVDFVAEVERDILSKEEK